MRLGDTGSERSGGLSLSLREFDNDIERYEWELGQRYGEMDRLDRWPSACGHLIIGPPLPPGAKTFEHARSTEAFKLATSSGYIAVRPTMESLGIGRVAVRRIFDRCSGIDIAYVLYDGKVKGSRYHCRMFHERSVANIKRDLTRWVMESKRGGKKTTKANICRSGRG
jgi:hypothetical protein